MPNVMVVIFHQPALPGAGPLTALLATARERLAERHAVIFGGTGARVRLVVHGEGGARSFGEALTTLTAWSGATPDGLVVLGSGSVPLLRPADARALVRVAAGPRGRALTNNRWSSDVCALSGAGVLARLPALRGDNALPRWLEEQAGYEVTEMGGRTRLALDLDSPLDLALLALGRDAPAALRHMAADGGLAVPRLDELRGLAGDPRAELLVAGRVGSRTLRWLERSTRCRVRFLGEERGMRSGRATSWHRAPGRPPRSILGRLLDVRGPEALASSVTELADGALIDSRVLLADQLGADESAWPPAEDRFASDLLRSDAVTDAWLAALTASAAGAGGPILLGGHTLVGTALPRLLAGAAGHRSERWTRPALG